MHYRCARKPTHGVILIIDNIHEVYMECIYYLCFNTAWLIGAYKNLDDFVRREKYRNTLILNDRILNKDLSLCI